MKTSLGRILLPLTIALFTLEASVAQHRTIDSPRSKVSLRVGEMLAEDEALTVRLLAPAQQGKRSEAYFTVDREGVSTTTIPQEFPLKVTIWRPTEETPYAVVVLEVQKEGVETELVDAVAISFDSVRFLDKELFQQLKKTHAGIPKVISELNRELNSLRKQPAEQDGARQPATRSESKSE